MRNRHRLILFCLFCAALFGFFSVRRSAPPVIVDKELIAKTLGSSIEHLEFPTSISLNLFGKTKPYRVVYTLDPDLQERAKNLLALHRPDFGAVAVFDATTGRLLAVADYSAFPERHAGYGNLALRALYPAASIFKIVTAAAAIEEHKMSPETLIPYNGQNHTLYRKNIVDTVVNRFTRYSTLRDAFAKSVNTVFGRLGLHTIGPASLIHYAQRFQFNTVVKADFPFESGQTIFSADQDWEIVQAASGFTLHTTLSPVHGALIASAIANNGRMMEPYYVDRIEDEAGHAVYESQPHVIGETLKADSASQMRTLMRETVASGTSRKSFRKIFGKNVSPDIELGGKTGSLNGKNPEGRVDWFVGYGIWKNRRIGVAAVTVHEKLWRVKSSFLAGTLIQKYFDPMIKQDLRNERKIAHSE